MRLRQDPDHTYEMTTHNNCTVPVNMKAILNLTGVPDGKRPPNFSECAKMMATIFTQKADPYQEECWLVPNYTGGFHYTVMVAAQVRIRKAIAQPDYNGYVWGYITKDGVRHENGRKSKAVLADVIGVWGEVFRKGVENAFYHETFVTEFTKKTNSGKGTWEKRPTVMILKVNRDQTHKFAYADVMGNLCTDNEMNAYADEEVPFDEPHCGTKPRNERRETVKSTVVESPTEQIPEQEATVTELEPAGDTEGIKDEEAAGTVSGDKLYDLAKAIAKADNLEDGDCLPENLVYEIAAVYLCKEVEEIEEGMEPFEIENVIRYVETEGIPDSCK